MLVLLCYFFHFSVVFVLWFWSYKPTTETTKKLFCVNFFSLKDDENYFLSTSFLCWSFSYNVFVNGVVVAVSVMFFFELLLLLLLQLFILFLQAGIALCLKLNQCSGLLLIFVFVFCNRQPNIFLCLIVLIICINDNL